MACVCDGAHGQPAPAPTSFHRARMDKSCCARPGPVTGQTSVRQAHLIFPAPPDTEQRHEKDLDCPAGPGGRFRRRLRDGCQLLEWRPRAVWRPPERPAVRPPITRKWTRGRSGVGVCGCELGASAAADTLTLPLTIYLVRRKEGEKESEEKDDSHLPVQYSPSEILAACSLFPDEVLPRSDKLDIRGELEENGADAALGLSHFRERIGRITSSRE